MANSPPPSVPANSSSKETEHSFHPSMFHMCRMFSYYICKRYSSMFITPTVVVIIDECMVCLMGDCCVEYASRPLNLELQKTNAVYHFPSHSIKWNSPS